MAYGWRAYAVPVLALVTVAALFGPSTAGTGSHPAAAAGILRSAGPTTAPSTVALTPSSDRARVADAAAAKSAAARTAAAARDAHACARNTDPQLVLVSVAQQRTWMCAGRRLLRATAVTTGKTDGHDTPIGIWQIQAKQTDRTLVGPGYSQFVRYWLPFNGDFGFHDASWQTLPFGSSGYRTQGSHGCVHLPTATMGWLYRWARVGATVTVTA